MPKENPYLIKENYKKVEEVREIENKELITPEEQAKVVDKLVKNEIPTFEEFMKTYEEDEGVIDNYYYEIDSYGDIRVVKCYGPGNSNSTDKDKMARTGSKWVIGTALTIGTIVCPPAGLGAAASVAAVTGTAKIVSNIAADKDSECKEFCDEANSLVWDSIGTSAKQMMIIKGGKEILK